MIFWATLTLLVLSLSQASAQVVTRPSSKHDVAPMTRLDGKTLTAAQATQIIEHVMAEKHVPGLAIAVINSDAVVYLKTFGLRDVAQKTPLNDSTVMPALSFSDAIVAFAAMQLVGEHVLDLDKPIYTYLSKPLSAYPEYATLATDSRYKQITARMLLDQTSGLPDCHSTTHDTALVLQSVPGKAHRDSRAGMQLLQIVVEQLAKQPLQTMLARRIFTPFGMTHTDFPVSLASGANIATGYDVHGQPVAWPKSTDACSAGTGTTTFHDMTRFLNSVLDGDGLAIPNRVEMFKPQTRIATYPVANASTLVNGDVMRIAYGLGWSVFSAPYGPGFFESGVSDGWSHYMVAFDDPKTALIIMSNSANGQQVFKELLAQLIGDTFTPLGWPHGQP